MLRQVRCTIPRRAIDIHRRHRRPHPRPVIERNRALRPRARHRLHIQPHHRIRRLRHHCVHRQNRRLDLPLHPRQIKREIPQPRIRRIRRTLHQHIRQRPKIRPRRPPTLHIRIRRSKHPQPRRIRHRHRSTSNEGRKPIDRNHCPDSGIADAHRRKAHSRINGENGRITCDHTRIGWTGGDDAPVAATCHNGGRRGLITRHRRRNATKSSASHWVAPRWCRVRNAVEGEDANLVDGSPGIGVTGPAPRQPDESR